MISEDVQLLEQDAIVTMFELDGASFGEGTLRFVPEPLDGGPVHFNGYRYDVIPLEAEGFAWDSNDQLPRPTFRITAMELAFLSLVIANDDLVGMPVKRIRTYRRHLDDGIDPDPEATFAPDYYVIEQKTAQTRTQIEFELSVKMDQRGRMIPHRQVLRDTCTHTYRRYIDGQFDYSGVTCPYAGDDYYDEAGNPVGDPAEDICGKRLTDCKRRFGENSPLPFRGYPGVGRY